jgi:peptide/nickel transport system permease protein
MARQPRIVNRRGRFVRFLLRRAIAAVALVFIVASGSLLLAQIAPGDYAAQLGGDPAVLAAERARLGLDRPVAEQYTNWLRRSLTLDLGDSFQYRRPVRTLVGERAANTALLAAIALILATALGIPCGIVTGSRRGGFLVSVIRTASIVLLSVPPLITSLVLVTIAVRTGFAPISGSISASRLIVPALALAFPMAAALERLQSQALRDALDRPNMMAALARGVPKSRVIWRHAWRLSLGPILAIYGVMIGSLFSGSFAVEIVTSWPGLGELMRQALMSRDTYLVAGCAAAGALFLAAGVLIADVLHAAIDPRIETERAG